MVDFEVIRGFQPRDRAIVSLLADLPVRALADDDAIAEMIDGRQCLLKLSHRKVDFGFDARQWYEFLKKTPPFNSPYRRQGVVRWLEDVLPTYDCSERLQNLRIGAENLWNADPGKYSSIPAQSGVLEEGLQILHEYIHSHMNTNGK
jgi:hypothetical protein